MLKVQGAQGIKLINLFSEAYKYYDSGEPSLSSISVHKLCLLFQYIARLLHTHIHVRDCTDSNRFVVKGFASLDYVFMALGVTCPFNCKSRAERGRQRDRQVFVRSGVGVCASAADCFDCSRDVRAFI